ncbi:MAG: PQQ-dependent sugar dehydrogenase [Nocardioides marinisabuli]|uniref:PQQ-dependent sugar dehydrogenase n=1 Tax=Nocardioides marinisabuli TaxID=419476 RepID=UPI00321B28A8
MRLQGLAAGALVLPLLLGTGPNDQPAPVTTPVTTPVAVAGQERVQPTTGAPRMPGRFEERVVVDDLYIPTGAAFAPDGEIFVAEKSGVVKVVAGPGEAPQLFADLNAEVHNLFDRGMLGIAVDPGFPRRPYVYVLYAYDHVLGDPEPAPRWGTPGSYYDECPDPADGGPGAEQSGCVASGRLSRLTAQDVGGSWRMSGAEEVLVEDWCMQYPSHATGSLRFGPDGYLYASAGEGAHYSQVDHGQVEAPYWGEEGNPCGDPDREGGSLRSQDIRTRGDAVGLSGSVIRIDPDTGLGAPGNPFAGDGDANAERIVAYGMRNPFRFGFRPGAGAGEPEVWVGDVGQGGFEEIDRFRTGGRAENFGWPCYEGPGRNPGFDSVDLPLCESLYQERSADAPYFAYPRTETVAGESCPTGSSSISGVQIPTGEGYPDRYDGALFFSDFSRQCIWVMKAGADGLPDPGRVQPFLEGAASPVDLLTGPEGDLYYLSLGVDEVGNFEERGGSLRRLHFARGNRMPRAEVEADRTWGALPLTVALDARGSSDPDGDELTFVWDLDDDGEFDDAGGPRAEAVFEEDRDVLVHVRVSDAATSDVATLRLHPGDLGPPEIQVDDPGAGRGWVVGDTIALGATATDPDGSEVDVSWSVAVRHCPHDVCHSHEVVGSGTDPDLVAPDHEHPSHLLVQYRATDARGLTSTESVRLDPSTARLRVRSRPRGLRVTVAGETHRTRGAGWTGTFIEGSRVSVSAPRKQRHRGRVWRFQRWSDGGERSHVVVADAGTTTVRAVYRRRAQR